MPQISYSIFSPETTEDAETLSFAFLAHFPEMNGAAFGAFRVPAQAGHIAGVVRERIERWASRGTPQPELLETAFEQLVSVINEACRDAIEGEQNPIEPQALDMAIGATAGLQLVLASSGDFRATFLREEEEGTFHVYDLLKRLRGSSRGMDKLFTSLVSGEVMPQDTLALSLPETIKEIGDAPWKQTLATMTPGEARVHLLRMIEGGEESGPLLIVRIGQDHTAAITKKGDREKESSIKSIEALRRTEARTSALLGGRWLPDALGLARLRPRTVESVATLCRACFKHIKHISPRSLLQTPAKILSWFGFFLRNIATIAGRKRGGRRPTIKELPSAWRRIRDNVLDRFNKLSRTAKLLFVLIIVFVVLFAQSVIYLNYRKNAIATREMYATTVAEIRQLRADAEASIIYRDETGARALLLSAREKIEALPTDSRAKRRAQTELFAEIESALVALRHEIQVQPQEAPPADQNQWLLAYAKQTSENPITAISRTADRAVAVRADGSVSLLTNDALNPLNLNLPQEGVTDAELFGDRLYALVEQARQIYRLRRQGQAFGGAVPWVSDGAPELAGARAMAIDGAIYALKTDGVVKFFTGVLEADWRPRIDPPLIEATRIWTSDEADGIYILEPKSRRLVVLDKTGNIKAQYIFPEGSNLKDFAVNEAEKTLTVLDGGVLKQISLAHLE